MNRPYIFCHMLTSLEKHWHGAAKDSWFQHAAGSVFYDLAFGKDRHYKHQGW